MLTVKKRAICSSAVVLVSICSYGVFIFAKKLHFRSAMNVALVFIIGFEHLFAHSKNTSKKNKLKSIKSSHPEDCALKCLQENLNPFLAKIPILLYCPYCPYKLLCCRTLESIDINENTDTGKFVKS